MRKPWVVKMFGVMFWAGLAWAALIWAASYRLPQGQLIRLGLWAYIPFTLFCLFIWATCTFFYWAARIRQAQAPPRGSLADMIARKPGGVAPQPGNTPVGAKRD